jgi:hypothetical protein
MLLTKIFLLLPFVLTLGIASVLAQESSQKTVKTETEEWREDLRYMAEQMPLVHKNLFHTVSREQFDAAVKRLDDRIPSLARYQIIVELARIVAMVEDGHTNLRLAHDPEVRFHTLPLNIHSIREPGLCRVGRSRDRPYWKCAG